MGRHVYLRTVLSRTRSCEHGQPRESFTSLWNSCTSCCKHPCECSEYTCEHPCEPADCRLRQGPDLLRFKLPMSGMLLDWQGAERCELLEWDVHICSVLRRSCQHRNSRSSFASHSKPCASCERTCGPARDYTCSIYRAPAFCDLCKGRDLLRFNLPVPGLLRYWEDGRWCELLGRPVHCCPVLQSMMYAESRGSERMQHVPPSLISFDVSLVLLIYSVQPLVSVCRPLKPSCW